MNKKSTLLTEGPIWRKILTFAIPLFLGNLFQQLYNTVDSIVVGNFVGSDALAAVGSSSSLIFLMVGFFNGIAMGAGVVIARYYGARDIERVQKSIHTMIAFGLIASVLLTIIGVILTPWILRLMGTPESVMPNSVLYFRTYFAGVSAVIMYNIASGIFQAVGDSRHPLYYLIISSITNVVLDLLFVGVFHMSVAGAALATVISQILSAVLAFYKLAHSDPEYRVHWKEIRLDPIILKQVISYGLPSGVQNSIISLANVVVQSNINAFGAAAVAGCGAYSKLEGFAFLPVTSFALSLTTFIGQNLGAKEYERAKKGSLFGILLGPLLAELFGILFVATAPTLIGLFNDQPDVVAYGVLMARTIAPFYFLMATSHCVAGVLRGAGKAKVPMFVMLICWCVIRVSYITIAVRFIPHIQTVMYAYPITWTLSFIVFLLYYFKADWIHGFEKK